MGDVSEWLWWDDEDAAHIRSRSARYPDAIDIEPDWTLEAATDPDHVLHIPDPMIRVGLAPDHRLLTQRRFVLTVIIDPQDNSSVTAWKARGADLRDYLDGRKAHS